ncbi:T9SS type A sorting domain-containing protein, partial [Crocinitomicaceae bacterium]|nr:T9SS type A sorting domain-containing protein [Crocinitomicaceae bacterium]
VETAAANYPRGSREEAEFLDYEDFKSTLHGYADANGNLQGLDSLTEVSARDAALRKRGHAQVQGQNLLCFFLGECNDAPEPPASGERMMNDESFEEEIFEMSESDRLEIFPNPSSTEITVSLDTDYLPVVIRIIDAEGKQVLKQQSMNEEQSLDISRLETGVYFVLVTDQQGLSYMKKLVKN